MSLIEVRVATRRSPLSLAQTRLVVGRLRRILPQARFTIVPVTTRGDRERDKPLHELGGVGLFSKEVNRKLLNGEADIAVHSLKDLPVTEDEEDLALAFPLPRDTPREAMVYRRGLRGGKRGLIVGTSSLRRRALLQSLRPSYRVADLRGNLDTRLRRLAEGRFDAIMVAEAGLRRLGEKVAYMPLDPTLFVPAPGQGIVAVAVLLEDSLSRKIIQASHKPTEVQALVERAFLRHVEAGCREPVGGVLLRRRGRALFVAFAHRRSDGASAWLRSWGDWEKSQSVVEVVSERVREFLWGRR